MFSLKKLLLPVILLTFFLAGNLFSASSNPFDSQLNNSVKNSLDKITQLVQNKKSGLSDSQYTNLVDLLEKKLGYLYYEVKNINPKNSGIDLSTTPQLPDKKKLQEMHLNCIEKSGVKCKGILQIHSRIWEIPIYKGETHVYTLPPFVRGGEEILDVYYALGEKKGSNKMSTGIEFLNVSISESPFEDSKNPLCNLDRGSIRFGSERSYSCKLDSKKTYFLRYSIKEGYEKGYYRILYNPNPPYFNNVQNNGKKCVTQGGKEVFSGTSVEQYFTGPRNSPWEKIKDVKIYLYCNNGKLIKPFLSCDKVLTTNCKAPYSLGHWFPKKLRDNPIHSNNTSLLITNNGIKGKLCSIYGGQKIKHGEEKKFYYKSGEFCEYTYYICNDGVMVPSELVSPPPPAYDSDTKFFDDYNTCEGIKTFINKAGQQVYYKCGKDISMPKGDGWVDVGINPKTGNRCFHKVKK